MIQPESELGFDRNEAEESLDPTMLPPGVEVITPEVRKFLCCNFKASTPCEKGNCSCRNTNIGCSIFCKSAHCRTVCCGNPWTTKIAENRDENEPDLSNNC